MSKEMSFIIFCIENYKSYKKLSGKEVLELFTQNGVFEYLNEFFDVLHTTGHNYINHDIDIYINARKAS